MRIAAVLPLSLVVLASGPAPGPAPDAGGPELFAPGLLSTPADELNSVFSPDGKELYFTLNAPKSGMGMIVVSRATGRGWSQPETVSFSGQYSDYDPYFSPDGQKLFFISNRPVDGKARPQGDFDIWVVTRTTAGWSAPEHLPAPVNSDAPEFYPAVAADGSLYFSTRRPGSKGLDLFRSELVDGSYGEPVNLGDAVNSPTSEVDSYIAPDQSYIIFASYGRPEGLGNGDLYISRRQDGAWTPAQRLEHGINTVAREYCPIVSPDGKYLYWTSEYGFPDVAHGRRLTVAEFRDSLRTVRNGLGNVYRLPLTQVLGE